MAGRNRLIELDLLTEAVLRNKSDIICETKKSIWPRTHPVWTTIYEEVGKQISRASIYTYVVNNKFELKDKILGPVPVYTKEIEEQKVLDVSPDWDEDFNDKNIFIFILSLPKNEFNDLILQTKRVYKDTKGIKRMRQVNVLKPQKWADIVSKKIYDDFRLLHGYNFKYNYINQEKTLGCFTGHCKCGSELICRILPSPEQEKLIKIKCAASEGDGICGKRQCRGEIRKEIVSKLETQSVESFRCKEAAAKMATGDLSEPHNLFSGSVLRTARYQSKVNKYLDADEIVSLSKMKRSSGINVIRDIGFDPIFVHFWSPHQTRLFNKLVKITGSRLCIDATGSLTKKIIHVDGEKSQHIFLYEAVLSSFGQQFSACGMFSERQDTLSIMHWLMRWIQSGAEYPKEVICDSSRALLNACCWAFTGYTTMEMYAEACMTDNLPRSQIKIDVAHYLKNWADFLKMKQKGVKKFYLFAIGQLILSRSVKAATEIMEALLLISQSETAGEGSPSLKAAVTRIKSLITESQQIKEIVDSYDEDLDEDSDHILSDDQMDAIGGAYLESWATRMQNRVENILASEEGDDLNPRYCPQFATRLLKQIKTIPMWSSIRRDHFGFGGVPASSAPVEAEFKIIKTAILTKEQRLDVALETLIEYYEGKLKLIDCMVGTKNKVQLTPEDSFEVISEKSEQSHLEDSADTDDIQKAHKPLSDNTDVEVMLNARTPLKDLSSISNIEKESSCFACMNGNSPTGAHSCLVCKKNIHMLDGCSVKIDGEEEGHGEKRLCFSCSNSTNRESSISLNDFENWRNLGQQTKKPRGYYLSKINQDLNDILLSESSRTLPILKNGISKNLGFVSLRGAKLSLHNTCGLDSLFQIFLAAVTDSEKVSNYIKEQIPSNPLSAMVIGVAENRINAKTYQQRAEIFLKYWKKNTVFGKIEAVDCRCNVVSLANFLFKNNQSFKEESICDAGCNPRIKALPSITISAKEMKEPLEDALSAHVVLPPAKCRVKNCNGMEVNRFYSTGNVVIIGVDMDNEIELQSIPVSFVCPKSSEMYSILGVVEYRGSPVTCGRSRSVGHYVAITKRFSQWVEYDDLKNKSVGISSKKLKVELLVYAKK